MGTSDDTSVKRTHQRRWSVNYEKLFLYFYYTFLMEPGVCVHTCLGVHITFLGIGSGLARSKLSLDHMKILCLELDFERPHSVLELKCDDENMRIVVGFPRVSHAGDREIASDLSPQDRVRKQDSKFK